MQSEDERFSRLLNSFMVKSLLMTLILLASFSRLLNSFMVK